MIFELTIFIESEKNSSNLFATNLEN